MVRSNFSLDANESICGNSTFFDSVSKIEGFSLHSGLSLNCLDFLFASTFCFPGRKFTISFWHQIQILLAIRLQSVECDSPLFCMYDTAHVLSRRSFACFPPTSFLKLFNAYSIASNSRMLICNCFSSLVHLPPIFISLQAAPKPPDVGASVLISTEGGFSSCE